MMKRMAGVVMAVACMGLMMLNGGVAAAAGGDVSGVAVSTGARGLDVTTIPVGARGLDVTTIPVGARDRGAVAVLADEVETTILPQEWANMENGEGIKKVLGLVLNILVYGIGVLATLGVIIAGIMYMTARDNEQQVAKAKKRLIEIVIGLIAWALMYSVMNWLIPGGWSGLM